MDELEEKLTDALWYNSEHQFFDSAEHDVANEIIKYSFTIEQLKVLFNYIYEKK